ncbi:sensor histidine kinase [Alkalihalobacillus sp. LMS39]|uniref:sensor histidine kinase n=1 Tax=Alkalihalobacillus sp. LMS39 TaxID=2924032 RepID=UPI001FB54590|nr:sensor histidine kinase [Alkalihalobacillus sp. LMS39]UOE95020.1 ATP-binding protein [Alkalihalobacillus sp. LMS39]
MKHWSIKKKVWIALSGVIVTVALGAIFLIYFLYDALYVEKQKELLLTEGESLVESYEEYGVDSLFFTRLQWTEQNKAIHVLFSDDPMQLGSGVPFEPFSEENIITFDERQLLLEGETVVMVRSHPLFQQDILGVAIPLFQNEQLSGAILLSMPLEDVYEPFAEIQVMLLVVLALILVIIFFLGNKIVNDVVNPLLNMKEISTYMSDGDFSKRMIMERRDELGQLAQSFNTLSMSLEKVEDNRREFLANVSHELRTPLSYMKGYAEAMEEGMIDSKKGLAIIQKESNRLERLVNDLLDLAQLEGDSYPLRCEPIVLSQVVNDVLESFEIVATQKNIQMVQKVDEETIVYGDSDRLEQAMRNILDNAIRYSPPHTEIKIELTRKNGWSELLIVDHGIGIPSNDLLAVKERFYRVNKARTRNAGGTGLGLAIVTEIIKKHEGEFELFSEVGKGTTAKIKMRTIESDRENIGFQD